MASKQYDEINRLYEEDKNNLDRCILLWESPAKGIARGYVANPDVREEIVETVFSDFCINFLKAQKGESPFRGDCKLTSYFYTITRNVIFYKLGKHKRMYGFTGNNYKYQDIDLVSVDESLSLWTDKYGLMQEEGSPSHLAAYLNACEEASSVSNSPDRWMEFRDMIFNIQRVLDHYASYGGRKYKGKKRDSAEMFRRVVIDREISYDQAATEYDIPIGTVKSSIYYLRDVFKNDISLKEYS